MGMSRRRWIAPLAVIGVAAFALAGCAEGGGGTGGFGTLLMLGHDWASPAATHHSYDLMARKVIPHFKRQLEASRASHEWAKGKRDQLIGRAGEAVVKAITEHVDEQKDAVH